MKSIFDRETHYTWLSDAVTIHFDFFHMEAWGMYPGDPQKIVHIFFDSSSNKLSVEHTLYYNDHIQKAYTDWVFENVVLGEKHG